MITEYSVQPEENDQLQQITATPLLTCQCMSKLPTGVKYELRMVGLVAPNLGLRRIPDRLLCLVSPKASYLALFIRRCRSAATGQLILTIEKHETNHRHAHPCIGSPGDMMRKQYAPNCSPLKLLLLV